MKNKKTISLLIVLGMIVSLFPIIAFAEGWDGASKTEPIKNEYGAYVITSAEELAWLADDAKTFGSSADAVLTEDIDLSDHEWTPIGNTSSAKYSGSFDGQGHTVSGLKVTSSAYAGLFGNVSGRVSDLTVKGAVSYSGYSTAYAGGITGYNTGEISGCTSEVAVTGKYSGGITACNEGNITGCINKGTVKSSSEDIGGIAGTHKGGKISLCANIGTVTNTGSYYAGGIAGRVQGSAVIENSYNMGDISGRYIGGIAGYVYSSSVSVSNTFSAGTIISTGSYAGGIVGQLGYGVKAEKITNSYFLKTADINSNLYAVQKESNDREDLCGKTEEELKSEELVAAFGGAFGADNVENPINNGYPILKWQNPDVSYKAVITVSPANAAVLLVNGVGEEINGGCADGVYTFENLAKGDYTYTVSCDEDDYKAETGNFTIANSDYYNTVELSPNTYTLSFTVKPENAEFILKSGETELTAVKAENGVYEYSLPNGSYTYSAAVFGFAEETDSVEVNKSNMEKLIMLNRLPNVNVSFALSDKTNNAPLDNFRTEIKSGNITVSAETDGSYMLPVGIYTYKLMHSGYAKCTGEFTVTEEDISEGAKIINLETESSSAWDGDLDEPEYSDGAWQISSGNELAWFAGYVNGTQTTEQNGASYNAVLANDIELGGEINWTPIGLNSYSNAYSGTFDGNGHTVSGLYINTASACQGLFGKISISSVIKNLTVEGTVKTTSTSSYAYAGGICGYNYKGEIINCINKVNVTSDGGRTGGICGAGEGDGSLSAKISQCANYGDISYETGTGQYKGGITGESRYTNISECANMGRITGNGNFAGGVVGDLNAGSVMTDCYNAGAITASGYSIGGIAGRTDLYGNFGMSNCYSTGEIQNTLDNPQNYGALIGLYSGGLNTNCYCLIEPDGINSGLSAIGKIDFGTPSEVTVKTSADEMRGILEDLNSNAVWTNNNKLNNGYPILAWQNIIFKYAVRLSVNPSMADFKLFMGDTVIEPVKSENGVYEYSLEENTYSYSASADGFYESCGEITVNDENMDVEITLDEIRKQLIKIDGEILAPDTGSIPAGHHSISVDYSRIGEGTENGMPVLAVYAGDGRLEKLWLADAGYTISAECDIPEGSVIKVLFWQNDMTPITNSVMAEAV